jgi:hypothetical protein
MCCVVEGASVVEKVDLPGGQRGFRTLQFASSS